MKWTFDTDSRALYVRLVEAVPAQQQEIGAGTIVDVAHDGSVIGIEFVGPPSAPSVVAAIKAAHLTAEDSSFLARLAFSPLIQSMPRRRAVAAPPAPATTSRRAVVRELQPV